MAKKKEKNKPANQRVSFPLLTSSPPPLAFFLAEITRSNRTKTIVGDKGIGIEKDPAPRNHLSCFHSFYTEQQGKERDVASHWLTMDPRVEMAFFTSSTFPAENLNTGETEDFLVNSSFSSVSFLVFT